MIQAANRACQGRASGDNGEAVTLRVVSFRVAAAEAQHQVLSLVDLHPALVLAVAQPGIKTGEFIFLSIRK